MYESAIAAAPDELLFYSNLAAVFIETGELDSCLKLCRAVLARRRSIGSRLPGGVPRAKVAKIYLRMAACFAKQADFSAARTHASLANDQDSSPATLEVIAKYGVDKGGRG